MPRRELLSLLNACKQNPDDEAARGVLADWLEEHGDEDDRRRAEFIRLELDSGPERGRPELPARRIRLWEEVQTKWTPFRTDLRHVGGERCDRGLLWVMATVKRFLGEKGRRWAGTEAWAWVEGLRITPKPAEIVAVMSSPLLDSVVDLDLNEMTLSDDAVATLARCRKLTGLHTLRLYHHTLGPGGLSALIRSPFLTGLRTLDLGYAQPTARDFTLLADRAFMPALSHVTLRPDRPLNDTEVANLAARPLAALEVYPREVGGALRSYFRAGPSGLRRLGVRATVWEQPDIDALTQSGIPAALEELDLSRCVVNGCDSTMLAEASRLRRLQLYEASPTAAPMLRSPALGQLTSLDLSYTHWGDASLITALPAGPLALDLKYYDLADTGLTALARWPGLTRCRVLNLHSNRITAAGIRVLVESPHAAGLRSLIVSDNDLGDEGIEVIATSPVAANLEELRLYDNGNGERGARALLASNGLTRIKELGFGAKLPKPLAAALAERFGPAWC